MVDINKLNRVKGILKAQQGLEIPTFRRSLNGYNYVKTKGYSTIYSNDGNSWYTDPTLKTLYTGTIEGFRDEKLNTGGGYIIPGANPAENNPNASIEHSAEVMRKASSANVDKTATQVENRMFTTSEIQKAPVSINKDVVLPRTITPPKEVMDYADSLGLKYKQVEDTLDKKERILKTVTASGLALFEGVGKAIEASQVATDSNLTKGADLVYDKTSDLLSKAGPYGQVASIAMKNAAIAGDIIQSLGGGTDQMTSTDKWMDSSFFSWNIGMLNGFGGKKADSFAIDQDTALEVGSSYGGTMTDLSNAAAKSGKKYGLFSSGARRKANRQIAEAKRKLNIMTDIADEAGDQRLAVQSMGELAGLAYSMMTSGGYDLKYTYAAKHGGMLEWNPVHTLEWEPQVELVWDLPTFKEGGSIEFSEELEWIPEFKEGGKTVESIIPETEETTLKNVIPLGALHKNKHHMEHAEGLTKKGIPVIDDDGEQQAEIEHSEIIFTLEVTKKLEEYYEIFYSDSASNSEKEQAAFEAGKLLVFQILENTEDRTGLIESCKKGGTLTHKTTVDDVLEDMLEWMPTVVVIEEELKEEKHKKEEKKSDKELMKEAIKEVLIELLTK